MRGLMLMLAALTCSTLAHADDLQVRIGQTIANYDGCRFATNIIEPGASSESHFIAVDCHVGEEIRDLIAPSWIVDGQASYGQTFVNGHWLGECWMIRQQLIDNASKSLLLECRVLDPVYKTGFESATHRN